MTKQQESLASLASSFASIAQSFREYVELYRANSNREAAKGKRPPIRSISTATYQRETDKQQDVPGFRGSGKLPGYENSIPTLERLIQDRKINSSTK